MLRHLVKRKKISTDIQRMEKKVTPGNKSNVNHKTRDEKVVDKSPEDIKNYSFVDTINFKCEGVNYDFNSKTNKL